MEGGEEIVNGNKNGRWHYEAHMCRDVQVGQWS